jgi:hypothetical protein
MLDGLIVDASLAHSILTADGKPQLCGPELHASPHGPGVSLPRFMRTGWPIPRTLRAAYHQAAAEDERDRITGHA